MRPLSFIKTLRTSFRVRVFTIVVFILTLITASFTTLSIYNEIVDHNARLIEKGAILAKLLAHNVRLGVFSENEDLLKEPVAGILRQDDVSFVAVFTLEGKALESRHKARSEVRTIADKVDAGNVKRAIAIVEQSKSLYSSENSAFIEFWAPVVSAQTAYAGEGYFLGEKPVKRIERLIGFVKIVLDKSRLKQDIVATLLRNSAIGAIFMLLSIIITYSVLNHILRPLKTLTKAITMLGGKGRAQTLPVDTADEIGRLAGSFNEMLEALKQRETEKQHIERQLRESQKMEAVGQLAGGVAHDFNNMLTAIISYGNVLQMKMQAEDPLRRHVERILSVSERAATLTQSLLAFSRKRPISLQPLNLNKVVENVEKLLVRLTTEDIEFRTHLTSEEPVIMGDAGQIEQVLMNLVTNAKDAMPERGLLTIETNIIELDQAFVSAHGDGEAGVYALLSVVDSGLGMDAETASKVFEPFFTTKETGKGTGLGLAVVYGIVKQHKGIINLNSQPGLGTTFKLYFPLIRATAGEKEPVALQTPTGGAETILLAEDDEDVRDVTKSVFEDFGYTVIAAADGDEAINKFMQNKDRIDILITDVIMPLKNGREVYKKISEEKPGIKALFTSGYTADIITRKGLIDEGVPFISKPVSPTILLKKVRKVLDS